MPVDDYQYVPGTNANCQYDVAVNVSEKKTEIELFWNHFNTEKKSFDVRYFFSFSQIADISIAYIVVDDELCCPSSIENFAKNNSYGFDVCNFFNDCNSGKHSFGYIQSRKVCYILQL